MSNPESLLNRWKLILGETSDTGDEVPLTSQEKKLEKLLQTAYGEGKEGGFGRSAQKVRKWLEGIRENFSPEVVSLMQKDALERQQATEMLLEPELLEKIEPDINLVSTILSLQELLPDATRRIAREVVTRLVRKIESRLKTRLQHAVRQGLSPRSREVYPAGAFIDWKKTIARNIKNFRPELGTVIPERWFGYQKGYLLKEVVLLVDKSESMIQSAIHASVIGAILASLRSIRTHVIFFDTGVIDVTGKYKDPVDILFSVPMGGGTDIGQAIRYASQKVRNPKGTILFLISDLDEVAPAKDLEDALGRLLASGVRVEALLALNEDGKTEYNRKFASIFQSMGVGPFSCTAEDFPDLLCRKLERL